eukprot:RCo028799
MHGEAKFALELAETLPALDRYFNDRYHYPVVVFHSPWFSNPIKCRDSPATNYLDLVNRSTTSTLIFEEVSLDFRPEMKARYGVTGPKSTCTFRKYSLQYYHMCRFFDYLIFHSATLKQFEYVWRMDGNIALAKPLTCDPFLVMRKANAIFGFYRWEYQEPKGCMGPIREWGFAYATSRNFTPAHLDRIGSSERAPRLYLGAWGVFKWSFFASRSFQDFIESVDQKGFVYRYRLGEQ